jgi:hypothetical protein
MVRRPWDVVLPVLALVTAGNVVLAVEVTGWDVAVVQVMEWVAVAAALPVHPVRAAGGWVRVDIHVLRFGRLPLVAAMAETR